MSPSPPVIEAQRHGADAPSRARKPEHRVHVVLVGQRTGTRTLSLAVIVIVDKPVAINYMGLNELLPTTCGCSPPVGHLHFGLAVTPWIELHLIDVTRATDADVEFVESSTARTEGRLDPALRDTCTQPAVIEIVAA